MTTLAALLTERHSAAVAQADSIAETFTDHRSGPLHVQIELEQALDDVDRYARLLTNVGGAIVRTEAGPYHQGGSESFFRDLVNVQRYGVNVADDAAWRLGRSARHNETAVRLEHRDVSSSMITGYTMPSYLLEYAATGIRSASPLGDLIEFPQPLDTTGMSVELGRMTTGVTAGWVGEGAPFAESDPISVPLSIPVKGCTSFVDVSYTLFERAGSVMDMLTAKDMAEAVGTAREDGIITGTGNLDPVGILRTPIPNANQITYADGTPTVGELVPKIAACASAVSISRKRRPDLVVMHSRRWFWICAAIDSTGAPIVGLSTVAPSSRSPYVGSIAGLPVLLSDSIPTNLGTGADQDAIIVMRSADLFMQDSPLEAEAMTQKIPNVRLWCLKYVAFTASRYPSAIGTVTGSGLNAIAT